VLRVKEFDLRCKRRGAGFVIYYFLSPKKYKTWSIFSSLATLFIPRIVFIFTHERSKTPIKILIIFIYLLILSINTIFLFLLKRSIYPK
jgi:hypothetical protein